MSHRHQRNKEGESNDAGRVGLCCSFCGKSQHEVRKMINGPAIYICSECVVLCIGIIGHEMADDLGREVLCDAARQWIGGEMADVSKTMIMLAKQIDALAKSLTPCPECASQILETPPAIAEQSEAVTAEPEGP